MKQLFLFFVIIVLLNGCHKDIKFDKDKWSQEDGFDWPVRNKMLNDLVKNCPLLRRHQSEVLNLLGQPSNWGNNFFSYQLAIRYSGIDPVYQKDLEFIYSGQDSTIISFKIVESYDR